MTILHTFFNGKQQRDRQTAEGSDIAVTSSSALTRQATRWLLVINPAPARSPCLPDMRFFQQHHVLPLPAFQAGDDIIVTNGLDAGTDAHLPKLAFIFGLSDNSVPDRRQIRKFELAEDQVYFGHSLISREGPLAVIRVNRPIDYHYGRSSTITIAGSPKPGTRLCDIVFTVGQL